MVTKKERDAIVAFLDQSRSAREAKRRLYARAAEEPERVRAFLEEEYSPEEIARDEILSDLRAIAEGALKNGVSRT